MRAVLTEQSVCSRSAGKGMHFLHLKLQLGSSLSWLECSVWLRATLASHRVRVRATQASIRPVTLNRRTSPKGTNNEFSHCQFLQRYALLCRCRESCEMGSIRSSLECRRDLRLVQAHHCRGRHLRQLPGALSGRRGRACTGGPPDPTTTSAPLSSQGAHDGLAKQVETTIKHVAKT